MTDIVQTYYNKDLKQYLDVTIYFTGKLWFCRDDKIVIPILEETKLSSPYNVVQKYIAMDTWFINLALILLFIPVSVIFHIPAR